MLDCGPTISSSPPPLPLCGRICGSHIGLIAQLKTHKTGVETNHPRPRGTVEDKADSAFNYSLDPHFHSTMGSMAVHYTEPSKEISSIALFCYKM